LKRATSLAHTRSVSFQPTFVSAVFLGIGEGDCSPLKRGCYASLPRPDLPGTWCHWRNACHNAFLH
jgi:hypothetical protein